MHTLWLLTPLMSNMSFVDNLQHKIFMILGPHKSSFYLSPVTIIHSNVYFVRFFELNRHSWYKILCLWWTENQMVSMKENVGYFSGLPRANSRFTPSQWETPLLCNDVSHWLGASLESALVTWCFVRATISCLWNWPGVTKLADNMSEEWFVNLMKKSC